MDFLCAPHMKLEEGPGRIVWRDCIYPGWKALALALRQARIETP